MLLQSYGHDLGPPSWGALNELVRPLDQSRSMPWPHNLYLEILAAQGVIGLIALLGVLGTALHLGCGRTKWGPGMATS